MFDSFEIEFWIDDVSLLLIDSLLFWFESSNFDNDKSVKNDNSSPIFTLCLLLNVFDIKWFFIKLLFLCIIFVSKLESSVFFTFFILSFSKIFFFSSSLIAFSYGKSSNWIISFLIILTISFFSIFCFKILSSNWETCLTIFWKLIICCFKFFSVSLIEVSIASGYIFSWILGISISPPYLLPVSLFLKLSFVKVGTYSELFPVFFLSFEFLFFNLFLALFSFFASSIILSISLCCLFISLHKWVSSSSIICSIVYNSSGLLFDITYISLIVEYTLGISLLFFIMWYASSSTL